MVEKFANSGDPDQTLHSVASDLGLYSLPITLLGVSRLQWVVISRQWKGDNEKLCGKVLCGRHETNSASQLF